MRIDELRQRLQPDKRRLDDELEIQPVGADLLSVHVADLGLAAAQAKEELAQVEARVSLDTRASFEKIAEKQLSDRVLRSPERQAAMRNYLRAKRDYEVAAGLLEAWRQRGYSLKSLAALHSADYFMQTGVDSTRSSRDVAISQHRERAALRQSVSERAAARSRVRVET